MHPSSRRPINRVTSLIRRQMALAAADLRSIHIANATRLTRSSLMTTTDCRTAGACWFGMNLLSSVNCRRSTSERDQQGATWRRQLQRRAGVASRWTWCTEPFDRSDKAVAITTSYLSHSSYTTSAASCKPALHNKKINMKMYISIYLFDMLCDFNFSENVLHRMKCQIFYFWTHLAWPFL